MCPAPNSKLTMLASRKIELKGKWILDWRPDTRLQWDGNGALCLLDILMGKHVHDKNISSYLNLQYERFVVLPPD